MHKTRLIKTVKLDTQVIQNKNKKGREKKKVTKSLGAFYLPHLEKTFPF